MDPLLYVITGGPVIEGNNQMFLCNYSLSVVGLIDIISSLILQEEQDTGLGIAALILPRLFAVYATHYISLKNISQILYIEPPFYHENLHFLSEFIRISGVTLILWNRQH